MKYKQLCFSTAMLVISVSGGFAQDNAHTAAVSALTSLLADPVARVDSGVKGPEALKAAQLLMAFPPHIQRRLENVILMILQESGTSSNSHVDALNISGPKGAFQSFSPAVQREIEAMARELEQDPEFMKKAGTLK
jgi:hypothetical protein